jgi:hypothetical protein
MGLLPANYEVPQSGGSSMFVKLEPGENRFRILGEPTLGYINWDDGKPTRFKEPGDAPTGAEDIKHFWFVPVWMKDQVCFLEMAQKSVITELAFLDSNEDWGDLTEYDVIVRREGEKLDTTYFVSPCPKKALPKAAKDAWAEVQPNYKPEQLFVENGVVFAAQKDNAKEELPF